MNTARLTFASSSPSNKTILCLINITLFSTFFFVRSIQLREPWIVPTFLSHSPHVGTAGTQLAPVNNWLKEGFFKLRLSAYRYPDSVETSATENRGFYASILPGSQYPIYFLFKLLDATSIVPNIYEKRGTQLLLIIFWNYLLHFLSALVLCVTVFFICRRLGFDHLNATLLGIVPSILQLHNAVSLYWHHLSLFHDISVLLPFALFVFLEILRTSYASSRVLLMVRVIQPPLMFVGVLVSWVFVFVILTTYTIRILNKEINLPSSLRHASLWIKQSFYFFMPALVAIAFWFYQIASHMQNIPHANLTNTATSGDRMDLVTTFLYRVGLSDGFAGFLYHLKTSLFTHLLNGYGLSGVIILYGTLYLATRGRKFVQTKTDTTDLAAQAYVMFLIPCLAVYLLFAQSYGGGHTFSPIFLSPALSLSFVFAPILILQIAKNNPLIPAVTLCNTKSITLVALLSLCSSITYGYSQIYNKKPITKFFSSPAYWHVAIGNFIKKNTDYHDVFFSQNYNIDISGHDLSVTHFHNKLIHFANSLDWVYYKTKSIVADHTIKIFYFSSRKTAMQHLSNFLTDNNIQTSTIEEKNVGNLLSFDGKEFHTWYERVHKCDLYPQRCGKEG